LDPPSFSRSDRKVFSTAKDLPALHSEAIGVLNPNGLLITSINSAQIPRDRFRAMVEEGARLAGRSVRPLQELGAPRETFPGADHLKGWIFHVG
jgi:23S rRNA (cytosine1962-C5)-methyltransferase